MITKLRYYELSEYYADDGILDCNLCRGDITQDQRYVVTQITCYDYCERNWEKSSTNSRLLIFGKTMCFGDDGPRDISEIVSFHRSLCDQASAQLDHLVAITVPRSPPEFLPKPSKKTQSWRNHGYALGHLHLSSASTGTGEKDPKSYRVRLFQMILSQSTVLLVKTGDDAHLSSPISFQPLFESGKVVSDVNWTNCGDYDVICVKIDVAMEYILCLIRREEHALGDVGQAAESLREEHSRWCEEWVDHVMERAGQVGIDTNAFTWTATRQVRAALHGEAFQVGQVEPLWEYLR
ncbi:hypothetical protein F4677DRAFT_449540 [Hypoxylon crocopeplum]|nr:hypothetical protein F4677DRAFT_449540 [Hypoxylon crocopeplum]